MEIKRNNDLGFMKTHHTVEVVTEAAACHVNVEPSVRCPGRLREQRGIWRLTAAKGEMTMLETRECEPLFYGLYPMVGKERFSQPTGPRKWACENSLCLSGTAAQVPHEVRQ
jgi:hypothetical protein